MGLHPLFYDTNERSGLSFDCLGRIDPVHPQTHPFRPPFRRPSTGLTVRRATVIVQQILPLGFLSFSVTHLPDYPVYVTDDGLRSR